MPPRAGQRGTICGGVALAATPMSRVDAVLEMTAREAEHAEAGGCWSTRSACGSGWRWRRPCWASRRCWSWTNPPTAWTLRASAGCAGLLRRLCHDPGKTVLVSSHLLPEVEQTVDHVVIISNGTLVKQGAMADLGGEAGAVVRTSDPAALARVLAGALGEVGSEPGEDGTLFVHSTDLQAIGDAALAAGLPVWELRRREADLEALFFELTEGRNRNLGEAV